MFCWIQSTNVHFWEEGMISVPSACNGYKHACCWQENWWTVEILSGQIVNIRTADWIKHIAVDILEFLCYWGGGEGWWRMKGVKFKKKYKMLVSFSRWWFAVELWTLFVEFPWITPLEPVDMNKVIRILAWKKNALRCAQGILWWSSSLQQSNWVFAYIEVEVLQNSGSSLQQLPVVPMRHVVHLQLQSPWLGPLLQLPLLQP